MLSERERERIEEEARQHEHPRAAVSEALLIVQESRGWVRGRPPPLHGRPGVLRRQFQKPGPLA